MIEKSSLNPKPHRSSLKKDSKLKSKDVDVRNKKPKNKMKGKKGLKQNNNSLVVGGDQRKEKIIKSSKRKRDDNVESPSIKKVKFDLVPKGKTVIPKKKGDLSFKKNQHKKNQKVGKKQVGKKQIGKKQVGKKQVGKSDEKNDMLLDMKKKQRKHFRKQNENKLYEVTKQMKTIWEELRRKDCKNDRKKQLVEEIFTMVKGNVTKLMHARDSVLILECMLSGGTEAIRTALFLEIKEAIIPLAKSKYGKFLLMSMLLHGNKEQKNYITKSFHGKVVDLMKHSSAAEVLESVYRKCRNVREKAELIQEFYGAKYKFFKTSNYLTLAEILKEDPGQKSETLDYMKEYLFKLFNKSVVKHSILHYVLWQFMQHCDASSRSDIIQSLCEFLPEIVHTKDGSKVAVESIWHGTPKDRKIIIKGLKPYAFKAAMEEYGHIVLIALFTCVDDTRLIGKHIIPDLTKNIVELSKNQYGVKVLMYLLNPGDPHYFHKTLMEELNEGYSKSESKKDPCVRQAELKEMIQQPLLDLLFSQLSSRHTDSSFSFFTLTILKNIKGAQKGVIFELIIDIIRKSKGTFMEIIGFYALVKHLIQAEKDANEESEEEVLFCETLVSYIKSNELQSWTDCNRGCFLLVNLIETGIPTVVERIRSEMEEQKGFLLAKNFKGAEVLLKKLK